MGTALISVIVLNQLVGPPLLEYALRCSAEDGLACKAQREGRSDAAAHVDAELQPVVDREGSDVSVASEGKQTCSDPALAAALLRTWHTLNLTFEDADCCHKNSLCMCVLRCRPVICISNQDMLYEI